MNADQLTFGLKDIISIGIGLFAIIGFLYAIKRTSEKAEEKYTTLDTNFQDLKKIVDEKLMHERNSKKANTQMIMGIIDKNKEEVDKKETQIYTRIGELKQEQQDAHEKLWVKLDSVETMQRSMSNSLAELTGYLKGKKEI